MQTALRAKAFGWKSGNVTSTANTCIPATAATWSMTPVSRGLATTSPVLMAATVFAPSSPRSIPAAPRISMSNCWTGERELLTTQFYLADHPGNTRDRLFNRMSDTGKAKVSMVFVDGPEGPETTVDIIV
jgi:hypothetical protein